MAIDIDNAMFNQFVQFAAQERKAGREKTIARVDPETAGPLATRTISGAKGDWVGIGGGRLASLKKFNNDTRKAFMDAIIKMFDGESNIPASVKEAMKLEDYGKGKPLTARRILAVRDAVYSADSLLKKAMPKIAAAASGIKDRKSDPRAGTVDSLVSAVVNATYGDEALLSLLQKKEVLERVLVGRDGIRTKEDALFKLAALRDGVEELRAATKGKPAMFEARLVELKPEDDANPELALRALTSEAKKVATDKGYAESELPKLALAAKFCAEAAGVDVTAAMREVAEPGSKANRLMNYGGRFMDSAKNFKNGLRLLDTFEMWFNGVQDALDRNGGNRGKRQEGMSRTLLNASVNNFSAIMRRGFEKFVFESIAHNPSFNLAETDANRLFGMENNVATHFFGRQLNQGITQTVAQVPPEKRNTFFAAVNMFFPVVDNAEEANKKGTARGEPRDSQSIVARVLKNLDKIIEMEAKGKLTFKNLARLIVPELPAGSKCELREVGAALNGVFDTANVMAALAKEGLDGAALFPHVFNVLQETGCSFEEAIETAKGGKKPPLVPYMSSGTLGLEAFDGTTQRGRMRLLEDLGRPKGYFDKAEKSLMPDEKVAFTFNFPREEPIATNGTPQGKKNIDTVMDKIESLCGKGHPAQALSVMTMVSQSVLTNLKGELLPHGITASEHSAVDFSLSRDPKTGAVTIRYSSPKTLPFAFGWSATVDADGKVTSEPLWFKDAKNIDDAARANGFSEVEVANLKKVADLCVQAMGWSKEVAFLELSTPGSKANRLMNYGGRFLDSAENFKNGLALIDKFESWFAGVHDELAKNDDGKRNWRKEGMSRTMLNVTKNACQSDRLPGTEKFVFESIARNPRFDLTERDANRLFGMENNLVTKFFGLNLDDACTQTIAQIPPEKRETYFSAVTLFYPLAETAEDANKLLAMRGSLTNSDCQPLTPRILKHFDEVEKMKDNGELNLENLVRLCFPELKKGDECSVDAVRKILGDMTQEIETAMQNGTLSSESYIQALGTLYDTGCSVQEAIDSCKGGPQPEPPKYVSPGTLKLSQYNGTTEGGRVLLQTDLVRPKNYEYVAKPGENLLDDSGFGFTFPDEERFVTNGTPEGKENIDKVCDKIELLCGKGHPAQASSVMMMLSQSALLVLRGGLAPYGLRSNEHSSCDFTLSKDPKTGDVTIRYSSPEGLPFEFGWTATIKPDGLVTTTPFKFTEVKS